MPVVTVLRKRLRAVALSVVACLAAAGLATAPAAQAAAAAGLHVTGKVDLGHFGPLFGYVFTEAPDGDVYYSQGSVVYVVKGDHAPVAALHASGTVLAVAANASDLFVDVGRKVTAYALSSGRSVRTWTLPGSQTITSAGLYPVGTTVWAFTDWATDESGLEYANVDRFAVSSASVRSVTANDAYPGFMAAGPAGLYFEGVASDGDGSYLYHALPSGSLQRHADAEGDIDAPLALAAGNVYLVAVHENESVSYSLDAFRGSTLGALFSRRLPGFAGIAGTGIGLLLVSRNTVSLIDPANGHASATLSVPGAGTPVPGPSAAVVTTVHSTSYLLRLAA
jgi:hypothetical protein